MEDDVQIFGLSYQKNGVVIYLHGEDYMRDQESQCGMSVNLQVKMLTVCRWICESEVKEESLVWDINFGVICVYT